MIRILVAGPANNIGSGGAAAMIFYGINQVIYVTYKSGSQEQLLHYQLKARPKTDNN